jgi:hypothetical protein
LLVVHTQDTRNPIVRMVEQTRPAMIRQSLPLKPYITLPARFLQITGRFQDHLSIEIQKLHPEIDLGHLSDNLVEQGRSEIALRINNNRDFVPDYWRGLNIFEVKLQGQGVH